MNNFERGAMRKDQAKSYVCRGTLKLLNVRKFPHIYATDAKGEREECI